MSNLRCYTQIKTRYDMLLCDNNKLPVGTETASELYILLFFGIKSGLLESVFYARVVRYSRKHPDL